MFGAYFVKFNETSCFLARGKPIIVESNSDFKTCLNVGRDRRQIVRFEVNVFIFLYIKQVEKMTAVIKHFYPV